MVGAGRFRQALGAAFVGWLLAVVVGLAATPAPGAPLDDLLPHVHSTLSVTPSPIPAPSEGRIPVSLRLSDSISTDDGSHPPAAEKVRFELDRQLQFDMAKIPVCKPTSRIPRDQTPCDEGKVASGRIQVEVAFPEEQPIRVLGDASAYKTGPRSMTVFTFLEAPVTGMLHLPVTVEREGSGIYSLSATASIPKIAGGSGSLTYIGLRFRKGLFSASCPKRRLQFVVADTFADGTEADGGLIKTCKIRHQ